ncbi:Methyl-CpG-binding domain-containing protein 9 [Phytophthora pseudosyringae]|uniref:Cation-transporting ATPase n=1 Tax=Phytophthora pseudosyringae TaxID=221518 RepID=A0A8T1VA04_9STRA|nr:Methyl-CpG-binding domain-containing protein 9 [Phytophthora pseudosyringae]
MDPPLGGPPAYSDGGGLHWTPAMELSPPQSEGGSSFEEEEEEEEEKDDSAPKPRGMNLLLAPRAYSSSEGDDDGADRSADSSETARAPSAEDDDEDLSAASAVMAMGYAPPPAAKQRARARRSDSIDDLELSIDSLRLVAQQRGLDTAALRQWSVRDDGKLLDPEQHKYRSLRDALRAYTHLMRGAIPLEDMYYLAILRRKLAELELPLVDGPISVLTLGSVVPEEHFYTSKKLFPIGYETLVNVQVTVPVPVAFRLRCKIVLGNKKKSPIFVVQLENSAVEIVFRSYVASKAWKKALVHFESLSADELMAIVSESVFTVERDDSGKPVDVLTPASGEDGFGLLRRNITRVLEGLHLVLSCKDYQFWEQRHPITPDVHAKIRSRLKNQVKDVLKTHDELSKEAINCQLSQEVLLEEHSRNLEDVQRLQQQMEKEQRDADKRSVREAARKLLEIEMKAQEDAKEAQRRAKEERKNAILEARMEAARQKEARKEALRLAREEEKRIREEEKEMKRALREEEKRKKMEEKENSMKRRIEELRQRRQMREEQKAILENGVVTSSSPKRFGDSRKRKAAPDAQSLKQQRIALLKFVEEERERRHQIRVWDKRNEVEGEVWTRVKARYTLELKSDHSLPEYKHSVHDPTAIEETKFPSQVISPAGELDPVPAECHADLLFVWDFISTFSDCLKLTALPSLGVFVNMMTLTDGSSPVGDGDLDDDSLGTLFASLHVELLKALITEYFPLLQMGNTLEEFHRTRPMNAFSWPELAREVCQLAMEFKHPSADEQLLKSIKGSKSYRDDAVTHPLRQKLHRRGTNLLKGVEFEEEKEEAETEAHNSHGKNSVTLSSEANFASGASSDYYGVVLVGGVSSKIKVGEKGQHLIVTEIVATPIESSAAKENPSEGAVAVEPNDDNVDAIRVGDYLMCINGQDVRELSLDSFNSIVSELKTPHGLLMSSVTPVVKNPMKHIATTQGATKIKCCGFVLKLLRSKEIAAPFNQPVDPELYPDYYSSGDIAEPMDLSTISEKIEDEDYENDDVESFVDDVQLVWKNCYTYNSLKAEISNLAQKLSVIFERLMKEWVYTTENKPMIAAEEDNCRNCQTIHAKGRLLLCDRCDAPYHTFCIKSPLPVIPKGEWFCPTCLADPSFSPEQFRKRAHDMAADSSENFGSSEQKQNDLTQLEKRLLSAIDLLSQENYSKLTIGDRLKVLRVLCELVEETSAVQSVYHSLEEKASDARKKLGESLADLEREWDRFTPPRSSHGVEQTKKFIIDGVEHELTDELLAYLEDKANAELESKPMPALPESAQKRLHGGSDTVKEEPVAVIVGEDDEDSSDNSDAEEDMLIEEFGDRFLLVSAGMNEPNANGDGSGLLMSRSLCAFCGLEDGILNGPLQCCKQSPLTAQTTLLTHYEVPELLSGEGPDMLAVRTLGANDLANTVLEDTAEGVQYSERSAQNHQMGQGAIGDQRSEPEDVKGVVYAINDRVVFGMSRAVIQEHLRTAAQPILLYLTTLPGEAVRASVSIVKCRGLPIGLNLDAHESFIFVQSYRSSEDPPLGFGELSGQVFPGDVLLMVNSVTTHEKSVDDVEELLRMDNPSGVTYAVFARPPSAKMRMAHEEWQRVVHDVPLQRAKESTFRAGLMTSQASGPISYDVIFQDGPLGLALALEPRGVLVKSLNDHPDGTLGQASLSGRILRGDLVERVNGATYGQLSDLSQFTSWLLSLPRPLKISFSRQAPAGVDQLMTPEQATKHLDEILKNPSLLCNQLKLPASSGMKTFRVDSVPLPFEAENLLESLGVTATKGLVYCEQRNDSLGMNLETTPATVAVGDLIVGLNGKSVAGLSWASVKELCAEMSSTSPVYLHLTPFVRPVTLLQAHESCAESANTAWSECVSMLPRVEKARELESFITWLIIPRTLAFGKCRHGYSFYRFFSDHNRLFVLSPDEKWSVIATREQVLQLLAYLEEDSRDSKIATRIRWCFHWVLHDDEAKLQLQQGLSCCEYSSRDFLRDGPFSIEKEVLLVMDGDMEKYESLVAYNGRKFFLGSFYTQQEAENALQHAETSIQSSGFHVVVAADALILRNTHFPSSLTAPYPKADNVVKRFLSRKYEYGSVLDGRGGMKPIPISHDVYNILKRGLRSSNAMMNNVEAARTGMYQAGMPQMAMPRVQGGDLQSSAYAVAQARYQEALKRKYAQTEDPYARQIADQMKRTRYADPTVAARMQHQFALGGANNPVSFKRSLQALVDQGRAMLAAWNQFAASATVQTTNGLAYACLSSFEEVKKVVSRIVVDPNATHPDPKTFVCLHHAYVMGLICAMATQALTTSQKTHSDSALVKQVADAFATAILSCVDPSNMLRARAISGFATAAKKCEPSQRAGDLSVELHNVANFVLMFLRTTHYLSGASFDDLSNCRPLFTASTPGVESLPASFVQQVNLLENIRQAFNRKTNMASSGTFPAQSQSMPSMPSLQAPPAYGMAPESTSMAMPTNTTQPSNQINNDGTLVDVDFGFGPLGVVINYSNRGTVVVTEFSNDNNNMMGQAQASGKVHVGDEVYAVNGQRLEVVGMEGFKAAVATSKRPLRVTFRRLLSAARDGVGMSTNNTQAQCTASSFAFPVSGAPHGTAPTPLAQVSSGMNPQVQQPNAFSQQAPTVNTNGVYGNQQPSSGSMEMGANNVNAGGNYPNSVPGQFPGSVDGGMNPFPYQSAPSSLSNPPMTANMPGFIGDMSGQSFPAAPMGGQNYNTLLNVYGDGAADGQPSGGWQGAPNPMVQPFPPGPAPSVMNMSSDGNVQMPMDPMPMIPNASSAMGYSTAPPPPPGTSNSYHNNNSTGEYVGFVAGNDPQLPQGDPSHVNYYDANGTTYRAAGDFEIDTSANASTESTALTPAPGYVEDSAIADIDTEPESPSISQMTTPAQSDTDGERSEADRQRDRDAQLARLTAASNVLQYGSSAVSLSSVPATTAQTQSTHPASKTPDAPPVPEAPAAVHAALAVPNAQPAAAEIMVPEGKPPLQNTRPSPRAQTGGKELRLTEETASRRSSRVSRKISNIADMYDPDFVKAHSRGGAGSGSEAGTDEPTDGEIGELSTELLEGFSATIRPLKKDLPRSLLLLRSQLLMMESAIPRDAFRSGRWGRSVRAAWAEMVYTCDTSAILMEAVVFLEANVDPEWLDPGWKASPLPSAKNAIATATIASAAMRLYSLDDAISYGRMKRGGKRKHRNPSSANSSRPGSPQKTAIISQESKASEPVSNPSELPFVGRLSTGLVALADKMIHNILEAQRERSSTAYAYRKASSEVAAITSLTDDQVEQWIQASSAHHTMTASASGQSQSGSGRHSTPKRKHPGSQPSSSSGQRSSSSRKRRAQGSTVPTPAATPPETQYVELRCFQMKTLQHCFPMGSAQDVTLRSRLEYIMEVLLRNELALAFSAPVNVNEVPGYSDLIKYPMDLGTIKIRLSRGFYDQRFEMLVRDVNLVWENCFTFNRLDAEISKCANRLRSIFNRLFEQWVTDVPPNIPATHLASEELCRQCGQMNAQESMLLCDSCDAAYHAFCLQPPLASIPPGNWDPAEQRNVPSGPKLLRLMAATAKASSALLSTRPQTYSDDNSSSDSDNMAMASSSADGVDVDLEDLDLAARAPRSGFVTAPAVELERVELLQQADGVQQALFGFGCMLSGGILAILASWKPKWKVNMLRRPAPGTMDATSVLVAHTVTWTASKKKKKMKRFYEECPLSQPVDSPPWFEFRKCRYVVDERESLGFSRLENALDEKLGSAQRRSLEGSGWSSSQVDSLTGIHGANELALKAQTWPMVLLRKVSHPFYVFQVFSGLVWLSEGYEAYAIIILVLSALSIVWEVHELVKNDKKLHSRLTHAEHSIANGVRVIRDSREKRVSPADLVVGDVVVIDEGVIPADIALLSGHCMADEATLTGEAIPVTKQALAATDAAFAVNAKLKTTHRESVLFAGSTVLELAHSSSTQGNRDETKTSTRGVVLSAGFSTSKGELFRTILFPTPLQLAKRIESDSYRFLGALSVLAFILFVVRMNAAAHDQGVTYGEAILSGFELITIAVPPALPVVLTAGVGFALSRLESQADVACIDAARMNIAGHIDCFCFDKTGTLSSDHLDFHGVDECSAAAPGAASNQKQQPAFHGLQREVEVLSPPAIIGLATCHGLTERSGQIQGYALEKDMFRATGYSLEPETSENTVMSGQFAALIASPIGKLFGVVARFPFDAARQRSSVVVEDLDSGNRYAYVKGSPEAVHKICTPNTLPSNYLARARSYAHQGFYVVALATKSFTPAVVSPKSEASQPVARDTVESSVGFLGFMLFVNQIKPDAPYVVGALEEAGVDVRIITGDDALTAIHVARKINMDMQSSVLLIDAQRQHEGDEEIVVVYTDVDELAQSTREGTSGSNSEITWAPVDRHSFLSLADGSSIAVTGAAIEQLLVSSNEEEADTPTEASTTAPPSMSLTDFAEELVGRTKVFARVRPHQKTWIVETLMTRHGGCVAMCGDGANDCGALKAAHVGLALSKDDAALVAPFTSRSLRVSDAVELLREGRGALSAAFVAFRYMVIYSVVQVTLSATMNGLHSQMSDSQFLFDDLVVVFILSLLMVRTPAAPQLGSSSVAPFNRMPPRTLFAPEILLSLLGQLAIFLGCVYIALAAAEARPWFCSAEKALELTRAASDGGETDPDVVQVPCYVFIPGEPADLTSHSYENSVLWRFGHLQYWIAAVALNVRDNYRAPLLRANRTFVAYSFVLLIILLVQLLGDNGNLDDEETSTSAAVANALKSRGVDVSLGALELPVGFAWSLFSLFLFDAGCVLSWEVLVVGMVLPRFQMQHRGGFRNRKSKFGGWRSYFGMRGEGDKQSLVSPYINERNGLLGDKTDKPAEGGKQVRAGRQSLQPIGTRGSADVVGSDDDEEQDVLDLHPPEIV